MADQPVLYAHRGTNPYTDNEIDAYKWAFNYGTDYVETDFRLTKDGVLVSYHDDLPGGIANMTLADVRAVVPGVVTLEELITLTKQMEIETGRKLGILIETKSSGYATYDALLSTLVAQDFADAEHIVFQTFATDHNVLRDLMENKYQVDFPLVWLTDTITDAKIANATSEQGTMGVLDALAPQMARITAETVAAAQAAGLAVNGWTVAGTEADVQNALELGVDGIINDNTQLARPALEKLLNNADVAYGTEQWDVLNGGAGADIVYAMAGDDVIRTGDGDDVLYGDAGNDLLFGGAGDDELVGGSGNDFLAGGDGADALDGGAGNDVVVATGDEVVFRAGGGIDLVSLDSTSTIRFDGVAPAGVNVLRDGGNLIIRAGSDAIVLLGGVDPARQPASITTADGLTLTGAELAALAVDGSDAEVAALLPGLLDVLEGAPAFAAPSTIPVGTDLVAAGDFGEGVLARQIEAAETGAVYRLSFSLADLPTGDDGVRVLWGGQLLYEGTPAAAGSDLHFVVSGGAGDGSNALVFESAGESFGAALDDVHLVKLADPMLPAPGNVAPEAQDAAIVVSQALPLNGRVAATDANGDPLTYSLGDAPSHGTLLFNADGSYRYTADAGFVGDDRFTYLANDGHGGFVEASVNLSVVAGIAIGADLIVNGSFEDVSESSGSNGPSDWGYRNPDGQIVGWTNVNNSRIEQHWDNYGGVTASDGRFWIDMDSSNLAQRHRIGQTIEHVEAGATYRVSVSLSDSDTVRGDDGIRVLWNGEVIFEGLPPQTGASWTTLSFDVVGGSGNGANRLEFMDTGAPDSWGAGVALDDVHFIKLTEAGETLPGNHAPDAVDGEAEGEQNGVITGQLTGSDPDADASLFFALKQGPAHGTVLVYTDGSYQYTPVAGFAGEDSFTFEVHDGQGGLDTATVSLTVKGPAPVEVPIGTDLIVNGSFEDVSESGNYNGGSDWGYRNLDGQIVGWTNADFKRIEQHLDNYGGVQAKDGRFWIDMDGAGQSARNRIGQTITEAETGATYRVSFSLSDSDNVRFDDGVTVLWNGEVIFSGLPPQTSASWTTLSFDVVGGSGNGANRLEFIDTGVADSWGAGVALDDVHFVKIANAGDALPENHAPTAADGHVTGQADTLLIGQVTASDPDADAALIFSLAQGPAHGSVFVYTDGTYRYTPAAGFTGEDSFTVLVNDGRGGSTQATVGVTITPPNAAPVAGDDNGLATRYGTALTIDAATLLANDTDANGDTLAILSVAAGAGGTVALGEDGVVIFTPAEGFEGDASFSYTVGDGKGGTATASVIVTVAPRPAGTPGDDVLSGTVGDDVILAGAGDDVVSAGAGNDLVEGGEGDDALLGEEGDDLLKGGAGDDALFGGAGDDVLMGGAGDDLLDGGAGIDTADYSHDTAGVVVDLAEGFAEGDGIGADELVSIETVIGGAGDDILIGDAGDNRFVGGAGDDVIDGGAGFDTLDLSGATGPVVVDAARGLVSGDGIGSDSFSNIEKLLFGAGDDIVSGGHGDESFEGGAGNDTLKGGAGDDQLSGGAGADMLEGGSGHDGLFGGSGDDVIRAGSGDDVIEAGEGDDLVEGGSGDDAILGGAGDDVIDAGSGADRIAGEAGDDILTGGSGHDVFVFAAGFGRDIVTDFRMSGSSADVLEFAGEVFAGFEDAMAAAAQAGADTVFTIDAETSLTLKGVQLASLAQDDFRFV